MVTNTKLYASTIAGLIDYYGATHLARILNVRVDELFNWANGTDCPPTHVFFRILRLAYIH